MANNAGAGEPVVLYEDNHLLVVNKPAGILTQSDRSGAPSILEICREYVREKYSKKGDVFLGMVHRLDRPVGGVLVFARTSKAASRLSEQIRRGAMVKRYRAVVEGPLRGESRLEHHLAREGSITRVVSPESKESQHAILCYRSLAVTPDRSLVEIDLITGRKHQIRAQMSAIGHPVHGDRKYGSPHTFGANRIALLSHSITLKHPTRDEVMTFNAPEPEWWPWP